MEQFLLAHLGIPLLAGLVFMLLVASSEKEPLSLAKCNDIALDFILLSIGASGAVFLSPKLSAHWAELTPVVGILLVLVDLVLASILVYRRRWRVDAPTRTQAYLDLALGVLGLTITVALFYTGYQAPGAPATGGQAHGIP
jgi:hypothetical protein